MERKKNEEKSTEPERPVGRLRLRVLVKDESGRKGQKIYMKK